MENVDVVVLLSRWLHIGAAIVAIGGTVFLRVALLPGAEGVLDAEEHQRLHAAVRKRWSRFVHGSIAVLLITGAVNFLLLAMPPKVEPMPYHAIFGLKFFAALAIFFLATALTGKSPAFARLRQDRPKWLTAVIILGALVVLLSGLLNQVRTHTHPPATAVTTTPAP
ncbi:MAG: hypothetical protein ACE5EX_10055 [Phycisphaerae bacterium]